MAIARSILRLMRLDSSFPMALMVFLPLFTRTRDLSLSLNRAMPLLLIGICAFIANSIDDVDKDRINHPERPLPSGAITLSLAAVLYFLCLIAALFATRHYVKTNVAFLYYALLAMSISYGYIVDCLPELKSTYVASATTVPVLIVAGSYPGRRLYCVAGAVFFFVLGKELCMDFVDRPGDRLSLMHKISSRALAVAAFSVQSIGLLFLTLRVNNQLDVLFLLLITTLFAVSLRYWLRCAKYKEAIDMMKAQLFLGLYFLM